MDGLISRFASDPRLASSLRGQVASIASAPNANSKQGKLQAFTGHVNAQKRDR
jgi:hypothetical protein